jgi:rhamnose transport system substrate-binding protein
MRTRKLTGLIGLVAAAAVATGVAAGVGSAGSEKRSHGNHRIFLIPKFIGIPVFTLNAQGAREAGRRLGDTVTYNGPTEASAAKQVPFIDTAVRQGYDAIVISANDPNAVAPALRRAQARGLKVVTYDADAAKNARTVYVSPPSTENIGAGLVDWVGSQIGNRGEIAIVSATTTAANQNAWIAVIKKTLRQPKYRNLKLVKIAYGNDNDTKSAQETQALLQAYPNLKGIIAPTSVGLPAAARVLQQAGKCRSIALTGLATPNSMRSYTKRGCGKKFGLWDEIDFGYLAAYVAHAVIDGDMTGKAGESLVAGRLGKRTIGGNNTMPMGPPLVFTQKNIDKYRF